MLILHRLFLILPNQTFERHHTMDVVGEVHLALQVVLLFSSINFLNLRNSTRFCVCVTMICDHLGQCGALGLFVE